MSFNIPSESLLDVIKFLNYSSLSNVQLVNHHFNLFINKYRNELALKKFFQIEIVADYDVRLSVYRRAIDIVTEVEDQFSADLYNIDLNDEQSKKWTNAIETHIPLYISEAIPEMSEANEVDSFLIFITKQENDNPNQLICIELPYYPATISDLAFIRFWLYQLSFCFFDSSEYYKAVFNPQLLKLLFSNYGESQQTYQTIKFQSKTVWLNTGSFIREDSTLLPQQQHTLNFVRNYLSVFDKLHLRVHAYFDGLLQFLTSCGLKVKQVVFHYGPGHLNIDLHNLLVYHAEVSKNCLKIIPKIRFENVDDFPWPDLCTKAKLIEEIEEDEDGLCLKKYQVNNFYYPSVKFLIKIFHFFDANEFRRFEIERIV